MVHLADLDAQKKEIKLNNNELFVAFLERFPGYSQASISFLLIHKKKEIKLRTYEYSKPFEKKDFKDVFFWKKLDDIVLVNNIQ